MNSNVVVKSGANLIIKDVVYFHQNAKLIVERGARLEINGGKLTNSCDGDYWEGVEVWGDSEEPQNSGEQGWLYITNKGCIENAKTAILANRTSSSAELRGFTGGVIRANGGVFINNNIAINLEELDGESLSDIYNCTFITNDDYQNPGVPEAFVKLTNYSNYGQPEISGCKFINKAVENNYVKGKGIGISSLNSSFTVDQVCTTINYPCDEFKGCSFENLYYAINSTCTDPISLLHTITNSEFINNRYGVYIGAINNAVITSNSFNLNISTDSYGLYLNECTGYQIEDNSFVGITSPTTENYGLYVNNSGQNDNLIYNNYFENLYYGASFENINRISGTTGGLCVKCNDFTDNVYDVFISGDQGIAANQGSLVPSNPPNNPSTYPAGNTFTSEEYPMLVKNIQDEALAIVYYYHQYEGDKIVRPRRVTTNVFRTPVIGIEYNKLISCPPTASGGSIGSLKTEMSYYSSSIDSTQNELAILVDNNNTDELNFNVQTSMPSQSIETRDLLLEASPNLSDTVMLSAIDAENVLPNAMVRDVLMENPQAAKSDKIQEALDNRTNTMPDYMRVEINEGIDTLSTIEIIRAQLAEKNIRYAQLFNKLHYLYFSDTTILNPNDSLMALYSMDGGLLNNYRIAWLYFMDNDTVSSDSILNNIQYEFELTAKEENERLDYITYKQLLKRMDADSIVLPDSLAISQLNLLLQNNNGMPSVYARNMLVWAGEINYIESLAKADTTLKNAVIIQDDELEIDLSNKDRSLIIKPNPANNYFIVSYKLLSNTNDCYISIVDIHGRLVKRIEIIDKQNEVIVNTSLWMPGTYIVSLFNNNELLESSKLNLIK